MQNLSDFSKLNTSVSNNENKNNSSTLNIFEMLNKYSGKSQNELICEFFKQVELQKKEGTFDKNKIVNIANTILPFLNSEQKELVTSILDKV